MNKIKFLLFIAVFSIVVSCKKDDQSKVPNGLASLTPDKKQWAFMGEVTSTTCGICGSSGYDNFNLMKKMNSGKIVALAFHCNYPSDSMQASNLLFSYEGSRPTGGGIPSFHIGDTKANYTAMQPYIDSILSREPEAQLKFSNTIEGNKMNVVSKIEFFKNVSGDYYVSFYLCESGINGSPSAPAGFAQTSGVMDYKHNNVVRAANANTAYGVKITNNATTIANTIFDYSCSIDIDPSSNKSNLFVTAVIWKKNPVSSAPCQYLFVNGWDKQIY